jgi:hypothetical protein
MMAETVKEGFQRRGSLGGLSSRLTLAMDREPGGEIELPSGKVLWLLTASLAGGWTASDSGLGRLSSGAGQGDPRGVKRNLPRVREVSALAFGELVEGLFGTFASAPVFRQLAEGFPGTFEGGVDIMIPMSCLKAVVRGG